MLGRSRGWILGSRAYSAASKARRTRPAITFPSTDATPSTTTPSSASEQLPTARSTPTNLGTPGSSTLVRPDSQRVREPPLVEQARKKSVKQRNVFESYLVLSWKTRLYFWLVIAGVATAGLYGGDYLLPETEEEKIAQGLQDSTTRVEQPK
ncbi:uncharacterized protein JCM15063_004355 [Sporobolomyces koalae]|uniref:uncharacterized protein n=1 Tax=Sporobolomyces koalae TaxID=500713 RepID=UPI003170BB19